MLSMAGSQVQRLQVRRSKGAIGVGNILILKGVVFASGDHRAGRTAGGWVLGVAGLRLHVDERLAAIPTFLKYETIRKKSQNEKTGS